MATGSRPLGELDEEEPELPMETPEQPYSEPPRPLEMQVCIGDCQACRLCDGA